LLKILLPTILLLLFFTSCTEKLAHSNYLNYKTKTHLIFPIKENSYIAWGGRTFEQNAHASAVNERFALDIVVIKNTTTLTKKDIKEFNIERYEKNPKVNDDYYCFDKEIIAVGNGLVVDILSNVYDNIPGEHNTNQPYGNYIIIDHGNNEYSMYGHLKYKSIIVLKNQKIKQGQFIGRCGNSGNSSEAHLHYHMQNTPNLSDGEGLPTQFNNYIANDKKIIKGELVQGQIIKSSI